MYVVFDSLNESPSLSICSFLRRLLLFQENFESKDGTIDALKTSMLGICHVVSTIPAEVVKK